jgi:multicomponent Na+:H+ antiporter subunit B
VSRRGRMLLFVPAALILAAGIVWAIGGLPDFGERITAYAQLLQEVAVPQRHGTNVVTSVVFDYRGVDTLGEEFILFAAAVGCTMLLRAQRGEHAVKEASDRVDEQSHAVARPVRALGGALVAPTFVLGAYIVAHGALTPGGGFQGGVVLAACAVLVYVAGRRLGRRRERTITGLELADALGAAGFALVAAGGLVLGLAAAHNFIGYGITGSLWSAGTIPLLSISVGVEVAGAMTLIVAEFLDQALLRSDRRA